MSSLFFLYSLSPFPQHQQMKAKWKEHMMVNSSSFWPIRNCPEHWAGCSLTPIYYPATLDHSVPGACWQLVPSCCLLSLALLFCQNSLPLPHLVNSSRTWFQCPSHPRKPSLNLWAFLWASRARRSKFRWPLRLIFFPFVAWQMAGSASLSDSPEEQADLVIDLCRFLLYKRPFPYTPVHCPIVV